MDRDLKRAKMLISLVHDGQLTDEEYRFLEKAIARYPELKLDTYRYERLHDLVGMVPGAPAPADIERRVLESIKAGGSGERTGRVIFLPIRRFPVQAGAIAAAVIICLAVLISYPSIVGTGRTTTPLALKQPVSPTASVSLGKTPPPAESDSETHPAEDVALLGGSAGEKEKNRLAPGKTDEGSPAPLDLDKKSFGLSPSGVMTATGVTAEKVSKVFSPTRDALLSTTRKEESKPMGSTTYIYSPAGEAPLPIILLIHRSDPARVQKEIMDMAVSLGGTVSVGEPKDTKGKEEEKTVSEEAFIAEDATAGAVSLPPEKIDELLDYLAARYPETQKEIQDLKERKTTPFLRIDVIPTVQ
jgi:hypothetical protein